MRDLNFNLWCKDLKPATQGIKYLDLTAPETSVNFLFVGGRIAESNLQIIKGCEKSGKSAAGVMLISCILHGAEFLGITPTSSEYRVLWADTEQDENTLRQRVNACMQMAGVPISCERLKVLPLKAIDDDMRLGAIVEAINDSGAKFVFIDGVVDLCADANEYRASKEVIHALLKASEKNKCAILCVIHENPRDAKARGHLGTILQQKASEIYTAEKKGDTVTVRQERSRFKGAEDFGFTFLDNFKIAAADMTKEAQRERDTDYYNALFVPAFEGGGTLQYGVLIERLIDPASKNNLSKRTAARRIASATEAGYLTKKGSFYSLTLAPLPLDDDDDL